MQIHFFTRPIRYKVSDDAPVVLNESWKFIVKWGARENKNRMRWQAFHLGKRDFDGARARKM